MRQEPFSVEVAETGGQTASHRGSAGCMRLLTGEIVGWGGTDVDWNPLNTTEVFSADGLTKAAGGNLHTSRAEGTNILLPDSRILDTGGWTAVSNSAVVEVFHPTLHVWTAKASMPVARWGHQLAMLPSGDVLAMGGEVVGGTGSTTQCDSYSIGANVWTTVAPMHTARRAHIAQRLNDGRILVMGGMNLVGDASIIATCEIYNPASNSWSVVPSMSTPRAWGASALLQDGRVLVMGGNIPESGPTNTKKTPLCEIYNPWTNTWSPTASMSVGGQWVPSNGRGVFVLPHGGVLALPDYSNAGDVYSVLPGDGFPIELYFPDQGAWRVVGKRPTPYSGQGIVALLQGTAGASASIPAPGEGSSEGGGTEGAVGSNVNAYDFASGGEVPTLNGAVGKLFMATGWNADQSTLGTSTLIGNLRGSTGIEVLPGFVVPPAPIIPCAISWTQAPLGKPQYNMLQQSLRYAQFADGRPVGVYWDTDNGQVATAVWSADGYTMLYSFSGAPSIDTHGKGTMCALGDGRVIYAGPFTGNNAVWTIDPVSYAWTSRPVCPIDNVSGSLVQLATGEALMVGGNGGGGTSTAAAEYIPGTNTWLVRATMHQNRKEPSATLLQDGRVLVAGGYSDDGGGGPIAHAEIYNPTANTWTVVTPMNHERWQHAATLLPDGRVLVAGTFLVAPNTDTAEIYDPTANTWTLVATIPTQVYRLGVSGTRGLHVLSDETVMLVNGVSQQVFVYDIGANTWTATATYGSCQRQWSMSNYLGGCKVHIYSPSANRATEPISIMTVP